MQSPWRKIWFAYAVIALLVCVLIDPTSRKLLLNTCCLTSAVAAISLSCGTLLGFGLARTNLGGRYLIWVWLAVTLLTPLHVQCAAWQMGWGNQGWLTYLIGVQDRPWFDGWFAAIWIHSAVAIPYVTVALMLMLQRLEREVEELASLEMSRWHVWWRVILPQLRPALTWSLLLIVIQTSTEIAVTDFFRIRTWAEEVYIETALGSWDAIQGSQRLVDQVGITLPETAPVGGRWLVATLIAGAGILLLCSCLQQLSSFRQQASRPLRLLELKRWRLPLTILWCGVFLLMVLFPISSLILKAGWVVQQTDVVQRSWSFGKCLSMIIDSPRRYSDSWWVTLQAAGLAMLLAVSLAMFLRLKLRTRSLWCDPGSYLTVLGIILPGPVWGVWLIRLFNAPSLPALNWLYDQTVVVIALAMFLRLWPWVWILITAGQLTIARGQWELAELEAWPPWQLLRRVIWPQIGRWCWAAMLLGLVLAVGELSATILVYPAGKTPLSVELFRLLHSDYEAEVAGLCLAQYLLVTACSALVFLLLREQNQADLE
jgi:iron(III) transport system permease protein